MILVPDCDGKPPEEYAYRGSNDKRSSDFRRARRGFVEVAEDHRHLTDKFDQAEATGECHEPHQDSAERYSA